jgi:alcohol dehydrogenase (cytochrome c)
MNRKLQGLWLVLACLLLALPLLGQHDDTYVDVLAVEQGLHVYRAYCFGCHGVDGTNVPGVDFRTGQFKHAATPRELGQVIRTGIPGTAMPAFELPMAELQGVVAYIRSLHDFQARGVKIGDAGRGQAVFEGKGQCLTCHRVNDKGSRVAPDLSEVGATHPPDSLERSLLDPNGSMLPQNRSLRAVTREGTVVTGRRLNEDTHSVQLIDNHERLVSLVKSDLREFTILKTSPMPSYKDKLSAEERADVIAYLASLKGVDQLATNTSLGGQVTFDRILHADREPQNWLLYNGGYASNRHSLLNQVTPANVKNLEQKWMFQANTLQPFETTPLVVDGVMYLTQPPNDIVALDAKTGAIFWVYQYRAAPARVCCGTVNRGLAILGDTLFMGTVDAHLVAVDAKSGRLIWNATAGDPKNAESITHAPLVVKDKVIVGIAGAEMAIRGRIMAYDVRTGKEVWRFNTIPGPGEPGHETWGGESWKTGGGSVWITGSYDPELNLTYWGIGNPWPDMDASVRPGDNLYTCSTVALDPDTGKLKWHYQFTPADHNDWDSTQIPVLATINWKGSPRKVLMWANRNAFFYVLDRETGQFLLGKPFVKQNWAAGIDENGRPIRVASPGADDPTYPGIQGGSNWYSPSFSPRTGLFYVTSWDDYFSVFRRNPLPWRRGAINTWTDDAGHGALKAIDPQTGEAKWVFRTYDVSDSGVLTTASNLLFTGNREGYFYALNATNGTPLWKVMLGGDVAAGPMTYLAGGKQYIAIAAGHGLFVYGLRE